MISDVLLFGWGNYCVVSGFSFSFFFFLRFVTSMGKCALRDELALGAGRTWTNYSPANNQHCCFE